MYVKIGPYSKWLTSRIHDRFIEWKYKVKYSWEYKGETDWVDGLVEKFEHFLQGVYNLTYNKLFGARDQKIKVKIHHYDTWSMDHTLAHIILPMLKQLQETKQGSPSVDDVDVPDELKSTAAEPRENDWDTDSNHHKRWDWVLNEMIWTFEKQIMDDWYASTPDEHARLANGFILFGKYYQGLWD